MVTMTAITLATMTAVTQATLTAVTLATMTAITLVTLTAITLATMTAVTQAMVLVSAEYLKCCRLTCIARGVIGLSLVVASVFFLYIGCTSRDQSAQHDSGGI